MIDAGQLNKLNAESSDSKVHKSEAQIKLVLKDKSILPNGYHWEEKGREFSYKGMFYDIVSITKTITGWEMIASSDEEEAAIVANQNKVHHLNKGAASKSASTKIKLNLTYAVYETVQLNTHLVFDASLVVSNYPSYAMPTLNSYSGEISHPPETV